MTELDDWTNFYIAGAGAAAALAGLFIVAISVNLEAILAERELPPRAAAAIAALVLALLACMAGLMRDQGLRWFGAEVLVFGFVTWVAKLRSAQAILRQRAHLRPSIVVGEVVTGQTQTVPFLVGAALLLAERPAGLSWVGFGVLAVFAFAMITAWVLLVEIRR